MTQLKTETHLQYKNKFKQPTYAMIERVTFLPPYT